LVALDLKRDQVGVDWYGDGIRQLRPPLNERILMEMASTGQGGNFETMKDVWTGAPKNS
jgi:hypothetical protein